MKKILIVCLLSLFPLPAVLCAQEKIPADTKISLQKYSVWKKHYTLTVHADGRVEFEGKQGIVTEEERRNPAGIRLGHYSKIISIERVAQILDKFHAINFSAIQQVPHEGYLPTDQDAFEISLVTDGQEKTFNSAFDCSNCRQETYQQIDALIASIESLVGIDEWIQ